MGKISRMNLPDLRVAEGRPLARRPSVKVDLPIGGIQWTFTT